LSDAHISTRIAKCNHNVTFIIELNMLTLRGTRQRAAIIHNINLIAGFDCGIDCTAVAAT
jgi:hypothetical protein